MPRYRFNLIDGQKIFDPTGRRLDDDAAAHEEAKSMARSLKKSPLSEKWKAIEVVDDAGDKIYKADIRDREDEQK